MTQLQQKLLEEVSKATGETVPSEVFTFLEIREVPEDDQLSLDDSEVLRWYELTRVLLDPDVDLQCLIDNIPQGVKVERIPFKWERKGLLGGKGRIIDSKPIPVLKLGFEQYLSWFRGYGFQVSATAGGRWSVSASVTNMTAINRYSHYFSDTLYAALLYSYVVEAGNKLDTFNEIVRDNPAIVEKFMKLTAVPTQQISIDYTDSWVNNPLIQSVFNPKALEGVEFQMPVCSHYKGLPKLLGVLMLTKTAVAFDRAWDGEQFLINLASPSVWDKGMVEDESNIPPDVLHFVQERLAILLLHYAGVWFNGVSCGAIPASAMREVVTEVAEPRITSGIDLYTYLGKCFHPNC